MDRVYTDGSLNINKQRASIGGFVSEKRNIVVQFSNKLDFDKIDLDANYVELLAIENGLQLAYQRGLTEVGLFSDSRSSILLIRRMMSRDSKKFNKIFEYSMFKKHKDLLLKLVFLIGKFKTLCLNFIPRKLNSMADILSKITHHAMTWHRGQALAIQTKKYNFTIGVLVNV